MQQKKVFVKGIDTDTADEYFEDGYDRYRLNVRSLSSENGEKGAIETPNGNTLVTGQLPQGTNKVIGSYEDVLRSKNYYFVYNSLGEDAIYEYDQQSNTIDTVLRDNVFNFSPDHLITGINIIRLDESNHLLYWTDGFNQPKKINIEKGLYYMEAIFGNVPIDPNGYQSPFQSDWLNVVKSPPLSPPVYTWVSTTPLGSVGAAGTNTAQVLEAEGANEPVTSFPSGLIPNNRILDATLGPKPAGVNSKFIVPAGGSTYDILVDVTLNGGNIPDGTPPPPGLGWSGSTSALVELKIDGATVQQKSEIINIGSKLDVSFDLPNTQLNGGSEVWVEITAITGETGGQLINFDIIDATASLNAGVNYPNYLFKKLYQFKYQYVYDDFEKSAFSSESKFYFPKTIGDDVTGDSIIAQDNQINIFLDTSSPIVKKIRIAAKEVNETEYTQIAEIDKEELNIPNYSTYRYIFLGNSAKTPIEVNENIKLFDNVPLLAGSQEIIEGERLVWGDVTEGFDPVDTHLDLNVKYDFVDYYSGNEHYPGISYHKSGGEYLFGVVYLNGANQSGTTNIQEGSYDVKLGGQFPDQGVSGTTLKLPFLTEDTYTPGVPTQLHLQYAQDIEALLYNKPPQWAERYQIVRTKNLAFSYFLQFCANTVNYTDGAGNTVSPAAAVELEVNIKNITGNPGYVGENKDSILFYDFVEGDRIRFIANARGGGNNDVTDPLLGYNDSEIRGYDASLDLLYITVSGGSSNPVKQLENGALFEIYRPIKDVDEEQVITYEIGETYNIGRNYEGEPTHTGNAGNNDFYNFTSAVHSGATETSFRGSATGGLTFSVGDRVKVFIETADAESIKDHYNFRYATITGVGFNEVSLNFSNYNGSGITTNITGYISKAAIIDINGGGDTFRKRTNIPFTPQVVNDRANIFVESQLVNNMFSSYAEDIGRPNRVDPDFRQVRRLSTLIYSEKFIPETFINGLSSVFDVNFETYNQNFGAIRKLHAEDNKLIMFQDKKIGQVLVQGIIYSDLQNNNTVGAAATVLSPQVIYYAGEYGIGNHPESFAVYGNAKYGIDVNRGVIWRLSVDGLTPVSNIYRFHNYTTDKTRSILSSPEKVNIYGAYDVKFGEYVLSFDSYTDVNGNNIPGETLSFDEENNGLATFWSYTPENIVSSGIDILTFKDGNLYKHNSNSLQSNFYGTQYNSEVWLIGNLGPSDVKVFEAISLESNDPWEVYEITTPNNQKTSLIESDFQEIENLQYAELLRDENTPVDNPLIEGDEIRDRTFLVKIKYNKDIYNKLFAVDFKYIISNRHNR